MTTNDGTVGRYLGWFLVALSLGAGVIHFAHAGEHFDLTWYHGTFFAVVAWLQLSWAAAVIVRPTRNLLLVGVLGNVVVIGTWVVSRTTGMPFGPGKNVAEDIALSDALATGFEAGIVLVALVVLLKPALAQQSLRPALGLGGFGIAGTAVAIVSTIALTPSFAAEHSHGEADGHGAAADASGHDHAAMEGTAAAEGTEHVEGHTDVMIMADGTSACEQAGVSSEGNSGHGHRGPVAVTPLTAEQRVEFRAQVEQSEVPVQKYATVKDAEAAGWRRITPYVPCIAAHYINNDALRNPFDPTEPEILLYDGTDPDSQIVGLSYLQFSDGPPEGFVGENDPWHVHESLCIGAGGVLGDTSTTDEDCAERGGRNIPLGNLWMTHMWNVPGWDSYWGLFSSEHPDLGGSMGNING
ncbi:MAG TPA: hypothetical protein VK611_21080 [Acidimicrobiales bacterium]|nr:hypothetical protein [Acidimicrobiales bacterium]